MSPKFIFTLALASALSSGFSRTNQNTLRIRESDGFYRSQEISFAHSALIRSKLRDQFRDREIASMGIGYRGFCPQPAFRSVSNFPSASNYSKLMDQKRSEDFLMAENRESMVFEKWGPLPHANYSKLADQIRPEVQAASITMLAQCSPSM